MTRRDETYNKTPKFFGDCQEYKGFYRYVEREKKRAHRWFRIQGKSICREEMKNA
jgi:hypothetical protein